MDSKDNPWNHIDPNRAMSIIDVNWSNNEAVRILSMLHADEADAIIFNLEYLDVHNPDLAEEVRKLQDKLKGLTLDSELEGNEEDIALVRHRFQKLAWEAMEDRGRKA